MSMLLYISIVRIRCCHGCARSQNIDEHFDLSHSGMISKFVDVELIIEFLLSVFSFCRKARVWQNFIDSAVKEMGFI